MADQDDKVPQAAPSIIHAFEQYTALNREFAGTVSMYFKALVAQGFTRAEALELTRDWQAATLRRLSQGES